LPIAATSRGPEMKAKPYKHLRDRAISRERQLANDREAARIVLEQLTLRDLGRACGLSQEELAPEEK
jgi:hypothetical protein